jgi:N-acetyl-anhydromuramyl-L-alanine amidase AmpD
VNARSIGIELPGPWNQDPRPQFQYSLLRDLLSTLRAEIPTLIYITGHKFIAKNKKDPGPGVRRDWVEGLGFASIFWERELEMLLL